MRRKPWCRAIPGCVEPAWIFPSLTVRRRLIPGAPRATTKSLGLRSARVLFRRSFDILYLLSQFFDFRFGFQRDAGNGQRFGFNAGSLGEHGVGFALHFLEQKIQFLSDFAAAIEQRGELPQVALQTLQFFTDIAAFRKYGGLLREAGGIDARAAENFFQAGIQAAGEGWAQGL